MDETIGRLLAVGNVAEVFEWGSRVLKLCKSRVGGDLCSTGWGKHRAWQLPRTATSSGST